MSVCSAQEIAPSIVVAPQTGLIDSDYRGEIRIALHNIGRTDVWIEPLQRVAQLVVVPVPRTRWDLVDALDETERGERGFGSTGS